MAAGDLSAFATLAQIAYVEATFAAIFIPAAWPVVPLIYEGQSNPGQIWLAADGWSETCEQLDLAQQRLGELTKHLSEDEWKGDDRTAFEEKASAYGREIASASSLAFVIHICLHVIAFFIILFIIVMFLFATLLSGFALAVIVASAAVVSAPAALGVEEEANAFATTAQRVLKGISEILEGMCKTAAITIGVLMAREIQGELSDGTNDPLLNLVRATLNGSGTILIGTLNYLEQKFTSNTMKGEPSSLFGRTYKPGLFGQVGARIKGLLDVLNGQRITGRIPDLTLHGTQDSDHNNKPDGNDYVDRTQPHR